MRLSAASGSGCARCHSDFHTSRARSGEDDAPRRIRGEVPSRNNEVKRESARSSTKIEFQVKTDEGDTVTLSLSQSERGSVQGDRSRYESKFAASVAVEGSLNEQELQDIQRVLAAFSQGQTVDDLGSLSEARYSAKSSFSYFG